MSSISTLVSNFYINFIMPRLLYARILYMKSISNDLRLDNTGAGVMEVNPSLFGNHMTGNVNQIEAIYFLFRMISITY